MQQIFLDEIRTHISRNKYKQIFRKFVQFLCCVVVFCTTYALILPAITMEQTAYCGLEEHTHSEECYQELPHQELVCNEDTLQLHNHSESCYDSEANLICGLADYVVHTHEKTCFYDGLLVCTLPDRGVHVHNDACYIPGETEPEVLHVHTDSCSTQQQGELLCTIEEYEGHAHDAACYAAGDTLECTLAENHVHMENCHVYPLLCTLSTEPHIHSESCYGTGELLCNTLEHHVHGDGCIISSQICENVEEGHEHSDSCYATEIVCTIPENHSHGSSCYKSVIICGKAEGEHHEHGGDCYSTEPQLNCSLAENHFHDDSCYLQELVCTIPEDPGHSHGEDCYQWETVLVCGLEEGQPEPTEPAEPLLNCTEPVAQEHVHGENCFVTVGTEPTPKCGITEEDHIHTEDCYVCTIEEHTHTLACYSDPEADVESPAVWESTFAHVALTGDWPTDVVAIAESQIGYTESSRNYEVWEDNSIHGYTRYGAWYGVPYGDWCGMFASFCLDYAGVEGMPYHYGVRPWIEDLASRGLYYSAKETKAQKGNLIFFDWEGDGLSDHVGIVAEVLEAQEHTGASIKTIEGNSSNCVKYVYYSPDDPVILGYGLLPGQERVPLPEVEEEYQININTDINLGPVVTITAENQEVVPEETTEFTEPSPRIMMFATSRTGGESLTNYLTSKGGNFFFVLTYPDGTTELPKDENENYIVNADTTYKLTMTITSPDGFVPGTYTHQLPDGLTIVGGEGLFVLKDGTILGDWKISNDGQIVFNFNDNANHRSDVTISAGMRVSFSETDSPIDFDGNITVIIHPPEQEKQGTVVSKWGSPGTGDDSDKINWTIKIEGNRDSAIPGNIITDTLKSGQHSYTDEDMQNGLVFGASVVDPTVGGEAVYHEWTVYPNDINLIWTSTGWTYQIPTTVNCKNCGPITLGNENWTYYVKFTTTPNMTNDVVTGLFSNHVSVDGDSYEGSTIYSSGETNAGIIKTGRFDGDTEGGQFHWEVRLSIPGTPKTAKPTWGWFFIDEMGIFEGYSSVGNVTNNLYGASVTMQYPDGRVYEVPYITDADEHDRVVWAIPYSEGENKHHVHLYSRCDCDEDHCYMWYESFCGWQPYVNGTLYSKYCPCWIIEEDVQIIFNYDTPMTNINDAYTHGGYSIQNMANLFNQHLDQNDKQQSDAVSYDYSKLPIPSLLKKDLTQEYDGYTANYTITVNEGKAQLSNGTPITIHDVMTETLVYAPGSMVITTEDSNGSTAVLTYGTDYTLTYDGSGNQTDDNGNPVHVLDIIILDPKPVKYILNYDAALDIPDYISGTVKYSNYATISIWGKDIIVDSEEKVLSDLNISAKQYHLELTKKASGSNALLPGAEFGLFNENGGLMDSKTTDATGVLLFKTIVSEGIILREHEPFYIQEISPPPGYMPDDTKYWFYFCDSGDDCHEGDYLQQKYDPITRLPGGQVGKFTVTNIPVTYELPSTGGTGYELYTAGGTLLMLAAVILLYNQKKCRKEDYRSS